MCIKFINLSAMFDKEQVRQQIIQYYKCVGSGENIIQAIKQAMFLNQNFSPLLLFQILSQGKQKIVRGDWKRYLVNRNISFSDKELRYFFRLNHFGEQITLNQFLQAMIPYNADVIREFRSKYLQSLQIDDLDPEVQFIFAELMSNWVGFIRNLIQIRTQITQAVSRRQIENFIKEDLVLRSKPREARKFHQMFQQSTFELSFHELRKFLQLWLDSKQVVHEFYLLNVKRHIKCQNPFQKIVLQSRKSKRSKQRSFSANKYARSRSRSGSLSVSRSVSRGNDENKQNKPEGQRKRLNSKNLKKRISPNEQQQPNMRGLSERNQMSRNQKYNQFKRELKESFQNEGRGFGSQIKRRNDHKKQQFKIDEDYSNRKGQKNFRNEAVQKSMKLQNQRNQFKNNQQPKSKGKFRNQNQLQLIIKIFEEVVIKQHKLQKLRKQLAKQNDFNIINLFKLIDNSNKGYISPRALEEFTEETNINYRQFVNFFAREKDKLRFQEFSGVFRPLSKELNEALDRRPEHRVPNPFKKDTKRLILQIIRMQGQLHNNLSQLRDRLKNEGVDYKTIFQEIDLDNKGYVTSEDLKQLLSQNNIECEAKDLKCLMKLLNKKVNQKISPKELTNFIGL